VTIEGFKIEHGGSRGFGIAARDADAPFPMRGLVIRKNTVRSSGTSNIYLSQVADSIIEGNICSGAKREHGIYLANGGSDNTVIRANIIYANKRGGIHLNGDLNVGGDGLQTGITIENNTIFDNGQNGINLDGVQDVIIQNNLVYNNRRRALRAYKIDGAAGPENYRIINNTFISQEDWAIKFTSDRGGHTFFNNILLVTGESGGSICVENRDFKSAHNVCVNRFAYQTKGGNCIIINFSAWQDAGYGRGSIVVNGRELFVDPGVDFSLNYNSPAVNAGAISLRGISVPSYDIRGVPRVQGSAPDIGAYETY
jgi:parallel beta-helix repeat protein